MGLRRIDPGCNNLKVVGFSAHAWMLCRRPFFRSGQDLVGTGECTSNSAWHGPYRPENGRPAMFA
ncbi:hypothetical protein COLO4_09282 [Corchorus olitorius]|uniref:Uncharacterized protein n=1 Tax=Corchorus olitorius TaxID=93759 RepID=A0A1R3KCJ6_9ROSI|nr:hypothetical protein COLO4_09282 [Corchorus olitorius]